MAMGEGRRTILTLPVFGLFGSLPAPVDSEFVDGVAVLGGAEVRFQPVGVGDGAAPAGGQAAVGEPDRMIHPCTSRVSQPAALTTQPNGSAIFTLFQGFF
jgi:hypothetical protein